MGRIFESIDDIITNSVSFKLWLYFLGIIVLLSVLNLIAFTVTILPALFILRLARFALWSFIVLIVLGIVFFVLTLFFESIVWSVSLNIARDRLEKGFFSWSEAWVKGKKRIFAIFKIQLLVWFFFGIVLGLLLLPGIAATITAFKAFASDLIPFMMASRVNNSAKLLPFLQNFLNPFLLLLNGVFVWVLLLFFSSPIWLLSKQVALWENHGTINALKRCIELGKQNYLTNLGLLIVFLILSGIILAFFVFILYVFWFFISFALISSIVASAAFGAKPVLSFLIIFYAVIIIVGVVLSVILTTLASLFEVRLYLMNIGQKPKPVFASTKQVSVPLKPLPSKKLMPEAPRVPSTKSIKKPVTPKTFKPKTTGLKRK